MIWDLRAKKATPEMGSILIQTDEWQAVIPHITECPLKTFPETERPGLPEELVWLSFCQRRRTPGVLQAQRSDKSLVTRPLSQGSCHLCCDGTQTHHTGAPLRKPGFPAEGLQRCWGPAPCLWLCDGYSVLLSGWIDSHKTRPLTLLPSRQAPSR